MAHVILPRVYVERDDAGDAQEALERANHLEPRPIEQAEIEFELAG
jgi:cytochrome c-type biogenesis protein CcmH/NrfG